MPRRLSAEQRESRDLLKRLTALIKTERASARAAAIAAEAAKPKLPTWQVRYIARYRQLHTQLRNAQQTLASPAANSYQLLQARMFVELQTAHFANLILDHRTLLTDVAGPSLTKWAEFNRQWNRREPAPLPSL